MQIEKWRFNLNFNHRIIYMTQDIYLLMKAHLLESWLKNWTFQFRTMFHVHIKYMMNMKIEKRKTKKLIEPKLELTSNLTYWPWTFPAGLGPCLNMPEYLLTPCLSKWQVRNIDTEILTLNTGRSTNENNFDCNFHTLGPELIFKLWNSVFVSNELW